MNQKRTTSIRTWLLFPALSIWPQLIMAQQASVTVSGYISETGSGEHIAGAGVFILSRDAGTTTNAYGFYSLTVAAPTDSLELSVHAAGYRPYTTWIKGAGNQSVNIPLQPRFKNELREVTVSGGRTSLQHSTQMSSVELPVSTIKALPAFLGEVDIMKALQLLPGVQAGSEGSSGLYVRGGGADQNLILLDGVPVYNASHLFGFFSVFNADAIRNVEIVKGGFPARYAGRLSSVIDIGMKEGDQTKLHGEGGIGLIASRLTLEGPIRKGKSSFMISGRRTYADLIAKPFMNTDAGYNFYDLNGKVNFRLGARDHVYLSGYFGNDKFHVKDDEGSSDVRAAIKWGNITAVGRWNHQYAPKLFGNLTAYYSRYRFALSNEERSTITGSSDAYKLVYSSGIEDLALKYDFDYRPKPAHNIKAGLGAVHHTYRPGAQQIKTSGGGSFSEDTTFGATPLNAMELDAYAEDDIRISARLKANIGLHAAGFSVRNHFFTSLQPRISARYLLTGRLSIKASYAQMAQYIHLLTNSSIGLPTDLWVPATDSIKPQQSRQVALGLAYTGTKGYEISLEGYYKTMDHVIEYREGASFLNTGSGWEDKVVAGRGWSYGGELLIQKKKGRLTGLLGYTLSWTNRRFDALNGGEKFPYRYDRRHDLKIAAVYNLSKGIDLSAEWVYGTGNAMTLPVGLYPGPDGSNITVYGARNGYRMPAYHRGDISIKFVKEKRRGERAWVISVYNVYNRKNPYFIYQDTEGGATTFKQVSLFPIIPSISYQFKF